MQRRTFLTTATAFAIAPIAARAAIFQDYAPGLIQSELAAGKTVFVDYSATWCGTCRRQARVIEGLVAQNPAYTDAMSFVKVDWDTYSGHEVTKSRGIPRRSTLLVLRGSEELGRIVAGTGEAQIKALMDLGMS